MAILDWFGYNGYHQPGSLQEWKEKMPFGIRAFRENVALRVDSPVREELLQAATTCLTLNTPRQKARCIREMMELMDRELEQGTRKDIMEACACISKGTLTKARHLKQEAQNLDDLLDRLNQAHIGGGHLKRVGNIIHAAYDRCYCGSVSQSKEPFSATYCQCSCGWYRQFFETLLEKPVEVELLGSILQGNERCMFLVRLHEPS
jgi:predicted hydrocarbon binding protein